MSDISLDALRLRERELELDAVLVRGRIEEVRMLIAQAERRRGGRPRKRGDLMQLGPDGIIRPVEAAEQVNGPQGVPGALFITPTDEETAA